MSLQKSLEEQKEAVRRQNISQKPHVVGLREGIYSYNSFYRHIHYTQQLPSVLTGQHKLALAQTRKEHLRLEKALFQQQRELKKLEQAYRTTKSGQFIQYVTYGVTRLYSKHAFVIFTCRVNSRALQLGKATQQAP